jgi:hypothetical protein
MIRPQPLHCAFLPDLAWRWRCLPILIVWLISIGTAHAADLMARQWRMLELEFIAAEPSPNSMDTLMEAEFTAPDGSQMRVPGFWDGGNTWKVRFTPTQPGEWRFETLSDNRDPALHGQHGVFTVLPAEGDHPLYRHGGFLKVSPNGHYLTYSDGTPFFWRGDTWWFCPSKLCPFDGSSRPGMDSMFKALVDTRSRQGYTVAQMAFAGVDRSTFHPRSWGQQNIDFWRDADRYFEYANAAGILPVIGVGFHKALDDASLDELKLLWRYIIARYGSYATSWMIAGEYNLDNVPERVEKILAVGRHIKEIDPYRRAMSVHPWVHDQEQRQAWSQPWFDFIMLQGGHNDKLPPAGTYFGPYFRQQLKPVLESESSYEGIKNFGPDRVRAAAYHAIQAGSFGYTYGSHGLWYPTQSPDDKRFEEYGKPLPWWEALNRLGAEHMAHLRKLYESVDWWRLEPRPQSIFTIENLPETIPVSVKSDGGQTHIVYFPTNIDTTAKLLLTAVDTASVYTADWFNPRSGELTTLAIPLERDQRFISLPDRPTRDDWVLVVRKK